MSNLIFILGLVMITVLLRSRKEAPVNNFDEYRITCEDKFFVQKGVYRHNEFYVPSCRWYGFDVFLREHRNKICQDAVESHNDHMCHIFERNGEKVFSQYNNITHDIAIASDVFDVLEKNLFNYILPEKHLVDLHNVLFHDCMMLSNNYYKIHGM